MYAFILLYFLYIYICFYLIALKKVVIVIFVIIKKPNSDIVYFHPISIDFFTVQ